MKWHRNLIVAVAEGLNATLLQKNQADQTVEKLLGSNKSWGARDRHFIADNIYTIIRYKRLYEYCAATTAKDEAAIGQIIGTKFIIEGQTLPGWELFIGLSENDIRSRYREAQTIRAVRESVPDWLDELGSAQLGSNWERELHALNEKARLGIRINTLKTNKEAVKALLRNDGIAFEETPEAPDALLINSKKNFRNYPAYQNGLLEIQDVSSQMVAPLLALEPGMNVIDGCAGAGGKTLHIAALLANKGTITAVDVHEQKLAQLHQRATRAGCSIIHSCLAAELDSTPKHLLHHSADRILLDVPCSGLGVLRRKPDAKWNLSDTFLRELVATQAHLLEKYWPMLRPDGLMVYSTCSILPMENEQQIEKFIAKQQGDIEQTVEKKLSPAASGFDGFYVAQLRKKC